jgi:hypothetical protein
MLRAPRQHDVHGWGVARHPAAAPTGCAGRGAPVLRAPSRVVAEGRRDASLGDLMRNRRCQGGARAGGCVGCWPRWGCGGGAGQQAKLGGWGRRRHRRPPRAGKAPCGSRPRARGAGAPPSRHDGRTVRRRRWMSPGSGRTPKPPRGRARSVIARTRSGAETHPMRSSGGTWAWRPREPARPRTGRRWVLGRPPSLPAVTVTKPIPTTGDGSPHARAAPGSAVRLRNG